MQRRSTVVASVVLALVLAGLGGTAAWVVVSIRDRVAEMSRATSALAAYSDLQRAVSSEVFAEAAYRREPSPESRARLETSIGTVGTAVDAVRGEVGPKDRALLSYLQVVNDRYAAQVRTDLDAPLERSNDRVAGPALDTIQDLIDGAVLTHQRELAQARTEQDRLVSSLVVVVPAVTGTGLLALLLCWFTLVRRHRHLSRRSAEHEHRSLHDPLTGLANRALFDRELAAALEVEAPDVAVLFVDLDDFKKVNDTHGHEAGDLVLVEVGRRLRSAVRGDDVVARLGGDEFAILLRSASAVSASASRLVAALREPLRLEAGVVRPTGSVGVAVAPLDGTQPAVLLRAADAALYRAKTQGKGRVSGASQSWLRVVPQPLSAEDADLPADAVGADFRSGPALG